MCDDCRSIKILIVDDNIMNLEILKVNLMSAFNLNCVTAENGRIAVDLFRADLEKTCCTTFIELVLMDYDMPVLNGSDASREIIEIVRKKNQQRLYQSSPRDKLGYSERKQVKSSLSPRWPLEPKTRTLTFE